jgi:hypothetical protein
LEKGFQIACDDLRPDRRFVLYGGSDRYPIKADVEVIGLRALAEMLGRFEAQGPRPWEFALNARVR